jgi:hypothetical protein
VRNINGNRSLNMNAPVVRVSYLDTIWPLETRERRNTDRG